MHDIGKTGNDTGLWWESYFVGNLVIGLWETRCSDLPCILADTDVSFIGSLRSVARLI